MSDIPILVLLVAAAALGLLVVAGVGFALLRRPASRRAPEQDLSVDVPSLGAHGPATTGPRLEFYGTPVRVAVLVIAPAGRGEPPSQEQLPEIAEYLLPGLMAVLRRDQPLFRLWPPQLSSRGFSHAFFNNMRLPGRRGKGTPWCSVVGKFAVADRGYLAGFVCVAGAANGLSEVVVEHEGQWLDVLRVREA